MKISNFGCTIGKTKTLFFLTLVLSSSFAFAQHEHSHDHQEAAPKTRDGLIWRKINDRLNVQIDVFFEEGDFPRCINLLRYSTELNPNDYEIWSNLGWMLENIQNYPAAIEVYRDYRKRNPQDPDASYLEASLYYREKEYDKVPPLLESDIKRKPHANSFRILAHSYEKLDRLKDSQATWKKYLALMPSDGAAKHNLQRVEQKLKDQSR